MEYAVPNGQRKFFLQLNRGFVIGGSGGATAMIAAAPADRYSREPPLLSAILYHFGIEGRPSRAESAPPKPGSTFQFAS